MDSEKERMLAGELYDPRDPSSPTANAPASVHGRYFPEVRATA